MAKKGLAVTTAVILLILIILFALPVVFKKQIAFRVKTELNDRLNARVDYKDLGVSLFHNFPNLTVSLNDFAVEGRQEFKGDTLAAAKEFNFTVDLLSAITGRGYKVISLNLVQPILKLKVNSDGRKNWDIIKALPATSSNVSSGQVVSDSTFLFQINNWKIEDAVIEFRNDSLRTLFSASGLKFSGNEKANKSGGDYSTETVINELSYRAAGINYLQYAKLNAVLQFSAENSTGVYQVKENRIAINELHLQMEGSVKNLSEGQDFDIHIQSTDSAFKNLLSVIPGLYDSSFAQLKSAGSFSISGNVKGVNNIQQSPALSFKVNVKDGELQKANFTQPLKHIFVDAGIVKPEGPMDSAVIEVSRLSVATGADSANARILITTPSSNAHVTAEVKGDIDLATLFQLYGTSDLKHLTGALHADLRLKGCKNDIDHKNYKMIQASGQIFAKDVSFQKKDWPDVLNIKSADFTVTPEIISMYALNGCIGKCTFKATGKFENTIAYLAQQSNLKAAIEINADTINLKELAGSSKNAKAADLKAASNNGTTINLNPKVNTEREIDLVIRLAANKVYDEKLVFTNVHGTLESFSKTLQIKDAVAGFLGGNVTVNASCNNVNEPQAHIDFDMKANNIDIARVYQSIDNADKTAPALKYLSGAFSGDITGNGKLKPDHGLDFNSLIADGNLRYPDLRVNEMPVLMEIGKLAKVKSLDHLEAKNVQSAFHFKNGNTTIEPTDIKFTNGYKLNFKGTSYANQTVDADIALDVPVKEFGQVASLAQNLLSGFMSVPDNVHFGFKVTGSNANPQVKVVTVGTSGN